MKTMKITDEALQQYRENVKDNEYTTLEQTVRKLTRNVQLVKEFAPERIKWTWKGIIYSYGNLGIKVRFGTVVEVVNHKEFKMPPNDFHYSMKRRMELNKKLGIIEDKFTKRSKKKRHHRVS